MKSKSLQRTRRLAIDALLGTLMFLGDIIFEALPNIHPVALLLAAYTVVYRFGALIPLYIYILLTGISWGFMPAWIPYLYVWLPLFLLILIIPRRLPPLVRAALYTVLCALHGLLFGILWAPAYMLMFNLSFDAAASWVLAGAPFDIAHAVGNAVASLLILPLSSLLLTLEGKKQRR